VSSANNLDLFKQSFREEAREILVDLESALLELNEDRSGTETVGRVFRGLHTIKGSGLMFGFEQLAAFTHDLETAFDAVRNGKLEITGKLIDLTLRALDQIEGMLKEDAAEETSQLLHRAELLAELRQVCGFEGAASDKKGADNERRAQSSEGGLREWRIDFAPGRDFLKDGSNPLLLIHELRQLGGLSVRAGVEAIPPLSELDPEQCAISWELALLTAAAADAIRDVFIFVEQNCELQITPVLGRSAPPTGQGDISQSDPSESQPKGVKVEGRRGEEAAHQAATSLRVPASKLDQFVDLVGELVTVQARFSDLAARRDDSEITGVAEEVERLVSALRVNSMNIRMIPVRATFEKFRRLVHDLARDLGKAAELTMEGAETELDKTVIEQLGDPLMHLIRNSMDHGIEPPDVRAAAGKRGTARIHLSARHAGASVLIEVSDDGAGIDAEAVRARALDRGLIAPDAHLSDAETFALIFQPGFSTAKRVTGVSGRGVGMDVVRRSVENLRGTVEIASKRGEGTTVALRIPLTLAIIDGLLVSVGSARFVLPLTNTLECIEIGRDDDRDARGHVVVVRGEIVPFIRLREHFRIRGRPPESEQIMVVETESGRFGLAVDHVLGDCQTVIKSLSRFYRDVQVISGATILGDGAVALILDPERLVQDALRGKRQGARGHPSRGAREEKLMRDDVLVGARPGRGGAEDSTGAISGTIAAA
jgi:two-component system, chemotaxis family, sensor kinase CheA